MYCILGVLYAVDRASCEYLIRRVCDLSVANPLSDFYEMRHRCSLQTVVEKIVCDSDT